MSLLAGLSLILGLTLLTFVVNFLFDYTKEFPIALVGVMIFGDIILVALWYQIGLEFITDISKFKICMSISFMIMSFARALIFFIYGKKRGWV